MTRQDGNLLPMQSRKRKREPELEFVPRVTYHVKQSNRVFERLFKENSLEELCHIIRKKLNLDPIIPLELHQFRDGVLYDLEDDDDFNAFKSATYAYESLAIYVKYPTSPVKTSAPHDTQRPKTSPAGKGKASKKGVSTPDSNKDEHAQNLSDVYNQIAEAVTRDEVSQPPRKKRKKEPDASISSALMIMGEKSNSGPSETSSKKPRSRDVNEADAESSAAPSAKPKSSRGKTKESAKEKRRDGGEEEEEEEGKEENESNAMKGRSQTVATIGNTGASENIKKKRKPTDKSSVDTPEMYTNSHLADGAAVVKAKHNSSKEHPSKQKKKKSEEKDDVDPPSLSKEAKSVEKPKRKKKDPAETPGTVADNREPPKKKKKVHVEKESPEETSAREKELSVQEGASLPSTKDTTVPPIANKAAEFPNEASTVLKENRKVSSSARTVVPLSTPSGPLAAPSLSALTGSKKQPTRKLTPKQQLCPLCNQPFHFRFKCPVINDSIESIEKKKAELQAKGGEEALISELEVWIRKKKKLGSSVATPSPSTISATPVALKSNQAVSQTRTVFPVTSARSEVTVESHEEGSESDDSTSDGEDNAGQTSPSSESPPPPASPTINLEDIDLGALVRGPVVGSLNKAFRQLEEEEEEQGGEGAGEGENLLEEVEEDEKMRKRLKVLRSKRVSFSELRLEGDEDESVSIDNDRSGSNEVSPVLPGRQPVQMVSNVSPSHEESFENVERDTSNVEDERTKLHGTPMAEETFGGRRVTDKMTPATEGTTVEIPGDNADPSKPLKRVNFADLAADGSDVEEEDPLAKFSGENMDDITPANTLAPAIAATGVNGDTTPPASSITRSPSPDPQDRWTSLSPARQPVVKTYARSPITRRLRTRQGNPQINEANEAVTNGQPIINDNGTNQTATHSPIVRRMRDEHSNLQVDEADKVATEEQPIVKDESTKLTATLTKKTSSAALEPASRVERPKRGSSKSASKKASSEVPSTSQLTPKRRGRLPLSEVVKAERQALKDAKVVERKAKNEVSRRGKKADDQTVTGRPLASTTSTEPPVQAENFPFNETERGIPLHQNHSLIKDPPKASRDRDSLGSLSSPLVKSPPQAEKSSPFNEAERGAPVHRNNFLIKDPPKASQDRDSLGSLSFPLVRSPPLGSQWKALPSPSETEPSQSSPQVDELIPSQATPKDAPFTIMSTRNKVQSSDRSRSVSHLVDEADVEEIIGTAKNSRRPLFLPGASQPTQVSPGPRDTEEAEEGVGDDENEYESARGGQYRDGSPSAASSDTEASSDKEPAATPKPAIKAPFPSLSQLTSSMHHLTRAPSFLMPARFAKMGQSQSQKDSVLRKTSQASDDDESSDEEDDSSEEERMSHVPKEKRAGAAAAVKKKKRKGLLED